MALKILLVPIHFLLPGTIRPYANGVFFFLSHTIIQVKTIQNIIISQLKKRGLMA